MNKIIMKNGHLIVAALTGISTNGLSANPWMVGPFKNSSGYKGKI